MRTRTVKTTQAQPLTRRAGAACARLRAPCRREVPEVCLSCARCRLLDRLRAGALPAARWPMCGGVRVGAEVRLRGPEPGAAEEQYTNKYHSQHTYGEQVQYSSTVQDRLNNGSLKRETHVYTER